MKKYKLYDTESEWNAKNAEIEAALRIPDGNTLNYAQVEIVKNSESDDHGKRIMPVLFEGSWVSTSFFNSGELVDWQDDWNVDAPSE
jgi:hypothetical protein